MSARAGCTSWHVQGHAHGSECMLLPESESACAQFRPCSTWACILSRAVQAWGIVVPCFVGGFSYRSVCH